jgi:hypothetical protein
MRELTAKIAFDRFNDMPDLEGDGAAGFRLAMVKKREDFLDIFEGARHVDAITYAESPELMIEMLRDLDIGSLDVLVGNAENYEDRVSDVTTAKRLLSLREDGRLTIRLKNEKTVHSKIYRVVMPDETVKLVPSSANLSNNSWNYHTNQVCMFTSEVNSEFDDSFVRFVEEYRKQYSHRTLLKSLVETLESADGQEERNEYIEYWVGPGDLDVSGTAALNQDAGEDIESMVERVTKVVSDPAEADETVAFVEEPNEADTTLYQANPEGTDVPSPDGDSGEGSDPDVGLLESTNASGHTQNLDRPRVRLANTQIRMGTTKVDDDVSDEFGENLRSLGATVDDYNITAPLSAYHRQVQKATRIPNMSVYQDTGQAVIGDGEDLILVAEDPPTEEVLNDCLDIIESYVETVEKHGFTQTPEAVMAQMYEAFLYGFWAPFANQYAQELASPSRTLDNILQHLYIEGKSDAGKDKLTEYILRLISDNTVSSGVDGDEVGVGEIRGIREWDTCFPYAIIDAEKEKIQRWSPIRNYWAEWTPTGVDQPCLIFTTNDSLPSSEFRNRMKILSMDVSFPSNPEDPGFHEAQEDLARVLDRNNPIFGYVARRMLQDQPWKDGTGTVEDIRQIFCEFYDRAGRDQPDYFPANQPAEQEYDTGRILWQRDIEGGRVTFESEPNGMNAIFQRDDWEVYDYEKRLSKRFMTEKSGASVYVGAPEEFAEWLGYTKADLLSGVAHASESQTESAGGEKESDKAESKGLLDRLLRR